jgi:hypothetical protein
MASADLLLPALKIAIAEPPTREGVQEPRIALVHSFFLLVAYAMENVIKGFLIGRDASVITDAQVPNDLLRDGGHDIVSAGVEILDLRDDEINLLERLKTYLKWSGRWPLPLKASDYRTAEQRRLRTYRTEDPKRIALVFDSFVSMLYRERNEREDPAMDSRRWVSPPASKCTCPPRGSSDRETHIEQHHALEEPVLLRSFPQGIGCCKG